MAWAQIDTQITTDVEQSAETLPSSELGLRYNPPNRGAPGDASTSDAGSRSCGLMVFEPVHSHWGETQQSRPSFWLYASNPGDVSFSLSVEETAEVVYQSAFAIEEGQVMTRYRLPETAAELMPDEAYRWRFSLDCPGDPDPAANGVIVFRELNETEDSQEEEKAPLEQAGRFAAAGFWFDAVDTLNQARLAETTEDQAVDGDSVATEAWISLLQQGGWTEELGTQFVQVATAPFSLELRMEASDLEGQGTEALDAEEVETIPSKVSLPENVK